MERVVLDFCPKKLNELCGDLADVICFMKGYRAGRTGDTDNSSFIYLYNMEEFNIKAKNEIRKLATVTATPAADDAGNEGE